MKQQVAPGKALGLECLIEGVVQDVAAVYRQKHLFSGGILPKGHVIPQPALHAAALVVVAAGTLCVVLLTAFKAIDIELPHIAADVLKVFNQLAVSQAYHPPNAKIQTALFRCCHNVRNIVLSSQSIQWITSVEAAV